MKRGGEVISSHATTMVPVQVKSNEESSLEYKYYQDQEETSKTSSALESLLEETLFMSCIVTRIGTLCLAWIDS
ncbi:hypothetical protein Tco_1375954 [Tanacetum coccineum]